jgi:3,4-dihydroxy 2-butanone 4-phosphate synthase/GTP cyclohydrolase II
MMEAIRYAEAEIPTEHGPFRVIVYRVGTAAEEHLAIVRGAIRGEKNVLTRVHSECMTGEVLGSLKCDCRAQLDMALAAIARAGLGVVVYLRQEGRGIGLGNKIRAYALQDQGSDTVEANEELGFKPDLRDYGIGAQILLDLGLSTIRLLTNNPRKIVGLDGYALEVTGREPLQVEPTEHNRTYLNTKAEKMGHIMRVVDGG